MKTTFILLSLFATATSAKQQPQTQLVLDRALATESDEGPVEITIDMDDTPCEEYYLSGTGTVPDHVDCLTLTKAPTPSPSKAPTESPTEKPTPCPTTDSPTKAPTESPTKKPTPYPPTKAPTESPTNKPTNMPTTHAGEIPLEPSSSSGDQGVAGDSNSSPTTQPTRERTRKPTHSSSGDHWNGGHHGSKSSKSHVDCDSSKSGKGSGSGRSSKSEKSGGHDTWTSHSHRRRLSGGHSSDEWWSAGSKSEKSTSGDEWWTAGSKSSKSTKSTKGCYHEDADSSTLRVSEMLAFKDAQNSADSNRSWFVNFALAIATTIAIIYAV